MKSLGITNKAAIYLIDRKKPEPVIQVKALMTALSFKQIQTDQTLIEVLTSILFSS